MSCFAVASLTDIVLLDFIINFNFVLYSCDIVDVVVVVVCVFAGITGDYRVSLYFSC